MCCFATGGWMLGYVACVRVRLAALGGDRRGVTSMEYALIAAATVTVTSVAVAAVGIDLNALWAAVGVALAP